MRKNKRRTPPAPPAQAPVSVSKSDVLDAVGFAILVVAAYKITWVIFALPDSSLF